VPDYSYGSEPRQLLLWLLLHPRNKASNIASHLLLQHGFYQLQLKRWCFLQSGLQLVHHIAAAGLPALL
jgi:hypothetical protein